ELHAVAAALDVGAAVRADDELVGRGREHVRAGAAGRVVAVARQAAVVVAAAVAAVAAVAGQAQAVVGPADAAAAPGERAQLLPGVDVDAAVRHDDRAEANGTVVLVQIRPRPGERR